MPSKEVVPTFTDFFVFSTGRNYSEEEIFSGYNQIHFLNLTIKLIFLFGFFAG